MEVNASPSMSNRLDFSIEHPLLASFLTTHPSFVTLIRSSVQSHVEQWWKIISSVQDSLQNVPSDSSIFMDYMVQFEGRMKALEDERASQIIQGVSSNFNAGMKDLVKDSIRESVADSVKSAVSEPYAAMSRIQLDSLQLASVIRSDTTDIKQAMQKLQNTKTTKEIGNIAEEKLYIALSMLLTAAEGYEVTRVNNIERSCDILIRRRGYPDIRVEVKSHSSKAVDTAHINRFEDDLVRHNDYGIMVNVDGGIVGYGPTLGMKQIESTGKFAFFVSNNNYDAYSIRGIMQVIYALESHLSIDETISEDENGNPVMIQPNGGFRITQAHMKQIIEALQEQKKRFKKAKDSAQQTLDLITQLSLENVLSIIQGYDPHHLPWTCPHCDKVFTSINGKKDHPLKCQKNPMFHPSKGRSMEPQVNELAVTEERNGERKIVVRTIKRKKDEPSTSSETV